MTGSGETLLLATGLSPSSSNPTASTGNAFLRAIGQHDVSGSSWKPSLSTFLISTASTRLTHPFCSTSIPPWRWATVCALLQWNNRVMQLKSKPASPFSLGWAQLGWIPALGHVVAAEAGWVNSEGNAVDAQEHVVMRGAAQAALTDTWHWWQISKHGLSFSQMCDLMKDLKEIWVRLMCEAQLLKVDNWHY